MDNNINTLFSSVNLFWEKLHETRKKEERFVKNEKLSIPLKLLKVKEYSNGFMEVYRAI